MEQELSAHIRTLAARHSEASGLQLSTIAQRAAKDWRFFARLDDPGASFTARKYDEVIAWFSENWLDHKGVDWPEGVPRPTSGVPA